jgi:hypothetical protein
MFTASASSGAGDLIARLLTGAWRQNPDPLTLSPAQLSIAAPLLLSTGAAALAWTRIGRCDVTTNDLSALREGYRKHLIDAAVHELEIIDLFQRVRASGIEPLLFKGWALARRYPDAGLRPYGDLDLWVRSEELELLYHTLAAYDYSYCVEPHISFYPQYERSFDDVMGKSQLVSLHDAQIRVPGDEDHLRFICLHFLFHGGWRPLWLCDVGLMVESADSGFDWDRCLRGKRKYADWIACVIGLAHQLLGANVTGTPVAKRAQSLPRWLTDAVLRQWDKGPGMSFAENFSFSLPRRLLKPSALVRSFREHWRNPIQASVEMNASFTDGPRGLFQFGSLFLRVPEFVRYFGREIRRT